MTVSFDTLIYTDCHPGQGLQGTAGLQFQACSSDSARGAMGLVRRSLLYEPPPGWMRERRPPSDYPPSFAHVFDGYLATAAGVYLGRELSGHREGNQLTHSIVTQDAAAYGHVRPAQLFRAPFWTAIPAPTTRCPPVAADWRPGPFDAATVRQFVAGSAGGVPMLTALVSALNRLDDAGNPRVLFLSRDPDAVVSWLTAATLLIPQARALQIGFKIFTTNPAYAAQQVLAVHPDWSTNTATVDNDYGYAVFDLTTHTWSRVEPTPTATLWARLFCTEDPYDVVDAVEVAAASLMPAPEDAAAVACAAVLGHRLPPGRAGAAAVWLASGPRHLVGLYGERVALSVLRDADVLPRSGIAHVDAALRDSRLADRAGVVWRALVRTQVDRAVRALEAPDGPPVPRAGHEDAEIRETIAAALASASPDQFEAILRVAARHGLRPAYHELAGAVARFIDEWRNHPEHGWDSSRWPDGRYLEEFLRKRLNQDILDGTLTADVAGDTWAPRLAHRDPPPRSALDDALLAAKVRSGTARRSVVESWVARTVALNLPPEELARYVSVPWRRDYPSVDELRMLCQLLPPGTPLELDILASLLTAIDAGIANPEQVGVYHQLLERRVLDRAPPPEAPADGTDEIVDMLLGVMRPASQIAERLAQLPVPPPGEPRETVVAAMLNAEGVVVIREVLGAYPVLARDFAPKLRLAFEQRGEPVHAAVAFYLTDHRHLPGQLLNALPAESVAQLRERLAIWVGRASKRRLSIAAGCLRDLDAGWAMRWNLLVREKSTHGRRI